MYAWLWCVCVLCPFSECAHGFPKKLATPKLGGWSKSWNLVDWCALSKTTQSMTGGDAVQTCCWEGAREKGSLGCEYTCYHFLQPTRCSERYDGEEMPILCILALWPMQDCSVWKNLLAICPVYLGLLVGCHALKKKDLHIDKNEYRNYVKIICTLRLLEPRSAPNVSLFHIHSPFLVDFLKV